jgi:hypothetical protein
VDPASDSVQPPAAPPPATEITTSVGRPRPSEASPLPPAPATTPAAGTSPGVQADCALAETHWRSAEAIGTLAVYEDHLARFPNCPFATLAATRIEELKQ